MNHASRKSYFIGFILSLVFTLTAYTVVSRHVASGHIIYSHPLVIAIIIACAIAQLAAQLVFFLHLGGESKPRWNLMVAGFAALVVFIIVFGSLWIMSNLQYNGMTPTQTDQSIIQDEGFGK